MNRYTYLDEILHKRVSQQLQNPIEFKGHMLKVKVTRLAF